MSYPRITATAGLAGLLLAGCGGKPPLKTAESLREEARVARATAPVVVPTEGAIWTAAARPMYTDFKARRVGDIVIVQVDEETVADAFSDTSIEREADVQASITSLFGLEDEIGALKDLVNGTATANHEGNGKSRQRQKLTTTVPARVVEVMPGGALVIQGSRRVKFDRSAQKVTLIGLVRTSDIAADGTVPSVLISDLELVLDGGGVVSDADRPAWLFRLLTLALPL